jgi:hypothetical protein
VVKGRPVALVAGLLALTLAGPAFAQGTADQAVSAAQRKYGEDARRVPWHDSTFIWQQRLGTQTLGVGGDYQSRDPYYDWVFYVRPRYYFWENGRTSLSVRGQLEADIELTNSNTSTKQRQFFLGDTLVSFVPEHAFVKHGEYLTDLALSLPRVVIPTSKAGHESGKILELGVRALFVQAFPLREGSDWVPRAYFGLRAGYGYQFASGVVPESSTLNQLRTDLEGHVVTNHQLNGAALAEHIGVLHGIAHADLFKDIVALESEFGLDPLVKFPLGEHPQVCNLPTGCAEPTPNGNDQPYQPATYLDVYLDTFAFEHALKVSFGYENITAQLGGDGQRRTFFWSPDAKLYLKLEFQPDYLLKKPSGPLTVGLPRERTAGLGSYR